MASTSDRQHPLKAIHRLRKICLLLILLQSFALYATSQVENVPVNHPVYPFLKRMEVKHIIERYHDAILPLSRHKVANFLNRISQRSEWLTSAEHGYLRDFLQEFRHEVTGSVDGFSSIIGADALAPGRVEHKIFSSQEKFLFFLKDTNIVVFVNGLLDLDARRITGDGLGSDRAEFAQFGGRIRGTLYDRLGVYLQATNAQFWGSRELLQRDRLIGQSYTLRVQNARNFDFAEGYVHYDAGIVSAQLGRERVLWGYGYDQRLTLSDNVRVFDFVKADVEYESLKYTFLHAWLLGKRTAMRFALPSDTSTLFVEPVVADKYFAGHRFEISFPTVMDIGVQEMVIYSNRAPDLAYLNPLILIESAQRSREERDNVFWAFDIQTRFVPDLELSGTFLFDDINFPDLFTDAWSDRHAFQVGLFYADPFAINNASLMIDYTRIEPYVFAHDRSRENDYGSLGSLLGPRIGSNADAWFFRLDSFPRRDLMFSLRVSVERQGENILDSSGILIKNVGGDFLQPHRPKDSDRKKFLDGILHKTLRVQWMVTLEIVNQLWLDARYEYEAIRNVNTGGREKNHTFGTRLRMEF